MVNEVPVVERFLPTGGCEGGSQRNEKASVTVKFARPETGLHAASKVGDRPGCAGRAQQQAV